MGYCPSGCKESGTTEATWHAFQDCVACRRSALVLPELTAEAHCSSLQASSVPLLPAGAVTDHCFIKMIEEPVLTNGSKKEILVISVFGKSV